MAQYRARMTRQGGIVGYQFIPKGGEALVELDDISASAHRSAIWGLELEEVVPAPPAREPKAASKPVDESVASEE